MRYNSGIEAYNSKDYDVAIKLFQEEYDKFKNPASIHNIGLSYLCKKEYQLALDNFINAYEQTKNQNYIFDISITYLNLGMWKEGMYLYKGRYLRENDVTFPKLPLYWVNLKEELKDRKVLVLNEQGFGDEIMFSRVFEDLSKNVKEAHIQVYEDLLDLFQEKFKFTNIHFFTQRTLTYDYIKDFNCYTCTGDIFSFYSRELLRELLREIPKKKNNKAKKVGIFYQANPKSKNAVDRSVDPEIFRELSSKYEIISLQKDHAKDLDFIKTVKLDNFLDTSKIIEDLEFIITIDSSIAHLGGFLGKQTYLLIKDYKDWRWNFPLYQSVKIIKNLNEISETK